MNVLAIATLLVILVVLTILHWNDLPTKKKLVTILTRHHVEVCRFVVDANADRVRPQYKQRTEDAVRRLKTLDHMVRRLGWPFVTKKKEQMILRNMCKQQVEGFQDILTYSMIFAFGRNKITLHCLPLLKDILDANLHGMHGKNVHLDEAEVRKLEQLEELVGKYPKTSVGNLKMVLQDVIDYESKKERNWAICQLNHDDPIIYQSYKI